MQEYLSDVSRRFPHLDLPTCLVRSNYCPASQDCSTIEAGLSSFQATINALEAKIFDLEAITTHLRFRLSNYNTYKDFQRSLLSPIRKVPDEILSHIFMLVSNHSTIDIIDYIPGDIWDLQRVCVRWRNIVRSTSSLWT
ncbi:hypothetical protein BDQ17DRAFT_1264226, partial [Cyathus striatus]